MLEFTHPKAVETHILFCFSPPCCQALESRLPVTPAWINHNSLRPPFAGLLLGRGPLPLCQRVELLAGEPLRSFHPAAQLQPPGVGAQRHLRPFVAAPQRPAAAGLAGGPVVRGGVSGSGAGLRAGSVPLRQPEGGLRRVSYSEWRYRRAQCAYMNI